MPVKFKPGPRKTFEESAHAISSVLGSSSDVPDSADTILASWDDIIQEDASCDVRDLMSSDDHGPSALQRVQHFCHKMA